MQAVLTSARSRGPSRPRRRGWLLGLFFCLSCAGAARREEVVVSSEWNGEPEERPLGRTLARWQDLTSPTEPSPPGLDGAVRAIARGDVDGAFEALELASAVQPENPLLVAARAHLEQSLGFLRAAESDFEAAIELDPRDPELWSSLGRVRLELRLFTRASRALEQAVALGRDDPEHHVLLALAYRGAGREDRSLDAWLDALRCARACRGVALFEEALSLASARPQDVLPSGIVQRPLSFLAASLALGPRHEDRPLDPLLAPAWDALAGLLQRRGAR